MNPDAAYQVKGFPGIAFKIAEGYADETGKMVFMRMVGDDWIYRFKVADCTPLKDDEFCLSCGQIGCSHN